MKNEYKLFGIASYVSNIYMSIIIPVDNKNINKIGPNYSAKVEIGRNCRTIWSIPLRSIYVFWKLELKL